ncbi:MAG: Glycerol-3-phosphate dehydrogenase [Hyphomicrobiales bacterium]|nr:Glycerol-3-phosphate dehydrogenase [Hyphomicrobiales bacterium]
MTIADAPHSIAVLGAGAWGTALANAAARPGREVLLWARDANHVAELARDRENKRRLPGVPLAPGVQPEADLSAVSRADIVLAVVPAQALRDLCGRLTGLVRAGVPIVVCAKGIERGTHRLVSDIVAECLPGQPVAVLSGPSFADDVARGLPTAVTLAAATEELASWLSGALGTTTLRLYHSTDIRGVEIGGAAKNVLAIACGIAAGRGLGASASAALIARGFSELARFAVASGARPETLMGLSGLGDLVLTCSSVQSRNYSLGFALGRGEDLVTASHGKLAEGAFTAPVLVEMAESVHVDMPIARSVAAILSGAINVEDAIGTLLARPQKAEG